MRIDKYLADANIGTRSQVRNLIKAKKISVNDQIVKSPSLQVNEEDIVKMDNEEISYQKFHYFMLNKPKGVISATENDQQKTVLDLLANKDRYKNLAPVGRLDKDTTGLLLITDDGQLNHNLLSPKKHVDKIYLAKVDGVVTDDTVRAFASGITLADGSVLKPAELIPVFVDAIHHTSFVQVTIAEGKYHQIKCMFASQGMKVLELDRVQMGSLVLDEDLPQGNYRELTANELASLEQ